MPFIEGPEKRQTSLQYCYSFVIKNIQITSLKFFGLKLSFVWLCTEAIPDASLTFHGLWDCTVHSLDTMMVQTMVPLATFHTHVNVLAHSFSCTDYQGRIKGGTAGAIAPGPPLQGAPPWWHLFILIKIFVWKIVVIQKRYKNTTLYSDVALSIINDFSASVTFWPF